MGYAKIFESLFDGSLRGRADEILVFVNLLTHATGEGVADVHFRKVSDETGLSTERVRSACSHLESQDLDSRTPDEQGRRIIRLDVHRDWGWRIVNHWKYRMMGGQDDRTKELTRLRVKNFRAKKEGCETLGNVTPTLPPASASASASVPEGNKSVREGDVEKVPWEWVLKWLASVVKNGADYTESETRVAWLALNANGWMWGNNPVTDWRSALECKIQSNRSRRSGKKPEKVNGEKPDWLKDAGTGEHSEARRRSEREELDKSNRKSP